MRAWVETGSAGPSRHCNYYGILLLIRCRLHNAEFYTRFSVVRGAGVVA